MFSAAYAVLKGFITPKRALIALVVLFVAGSVIAAVWHYVSLRDERARFLQRAQDAESKVVQLQEINTENLLELSRLRENSRLNAMARKREREAERRRLDLLERGLREIDSIKDADRPIDPWLAAAFASLRGEGGDSSNQD